MKDIVERLRELAVELYDQHNEIDIPLTQAANELEELRGRIETLMYAMESADDRLDDQTDGWHERIEDAQRILFNALHNDIIESSNLDGN